MTIGSLLIVLQFEQRISLFANISTFAKRMRNSYFSPQVLIQNRFCCFTVSAHIFMTDNYSLGIFYLITDGMYFDNIHIVIQTGLSYLVKLSQNIPEGYFLRNTNISVLFIKCY